MQARHHRLGPEASLRRMDLRPRVLEPEGRSQDRGQAGPAEGRRVPQHPRRRRRQPWYVQKILI